MLEDEYFIFDSLDRWGLDEIESLVCPLCGATNEVEVFDPEMIQEELCGSCGGGYQINWRDIQNSQ